jgi:hypothetical protein
MLILLDIDGVMVPAKSWKKPEFHDDGFPVFSAKSVKALQKIISATHATLVLTTSHKAKYSPAKWRNMFKSRGINVDAVSRLAKNDINSNRKDEILNWYQSKHKANEQFVLIDDDKLLNDLPEGIRENLVLTSSSIGLTDELADNAISILKQQKLTYV